MLAGTLKARVQVELLVSIQKRFLPRDARYTITSIAKTLNKFICLMFFLLIEPDVLRYVQRSAMQGSSTSSFVGKSPAWVDK